MDVLWWWAFPALVTIVAVGWAAWVRRPPRRLGDADTVAAYETFRAALARSSAPPRNTRSDPNV